MAIIALLTALEARPINIRRLREGFQPPYVLSLLRYHRPAFDDLAHEKQLELVEQTSKRVDNLLTASRKLVEYLEYGVPDRDTRPVLENANRDVQAAVLRDVEGLKLLEIAKRLNLTVTSEKGKEWDNSRVREMVKRGRKLLESALGKEGWQKQIKAMNRDADWFRELTETEKALYRRLS